jgi:hypothetical protein
LLSTTEFSIGNLEHVVDSLFTVALTRLLLHLSLKQIEVLDHIALESNSLNVHA